MPMITEQTNVIDSSVKRNIQLNYIYTALMYATLTKGIWVLFLSYRGMSLVQIGLIESVFQMASLIFGAPAGAISDMLGRKVSLVLGTIASILGNILVLVSNDFYGFAAGFMFNAIGTVLFTGASESITYDSCKILGRETDYKKVWGSILALSFVATALGIAAGGFIASVSFEYAYYATIGILLIALVPALLFKETGGISINHGRDKRMGLMQLFSVSLGMICKDAVILYVLVISASLTVVDMTIYLYCQKYFQAMSIPVFAIGMIFCFDSIFAAAGARYAYLLVERFHNRNVILIISAVIIGSYALLAVLNNILSVICLYMATIFVVAFWPIVSELINSRVPSENRATVLALKGQLTNLAVMIIFPVVGFLAEKSSLSTAFLWLLVSGIPLIAYTVIKIRREVTQS